jgi:serine/threonine protein kinase
LRDGHACQQHCAVVQSCGMAEVSSPDCGSVLEPIPSPSPDPVQSHVSPMAATIGSQYRIERRCGLGAMSRVYQAYHLGLARRFAVKILRQEYRHKAEVVARFVREVQKVARLAHRNIVKVAECGRTTDGVPFFVMEYVDGFTIRQLLDRGGPLSVERALNIGLELASALECAHEALLVHGDLKPNNVMIVAQGEGAGGVRVLDFGLSGNLEREDGAPTLTGEVMIGSSDYLAPEQAEGMPADRKSDLYALGELIYEMISGVPAWSGENAAEVIHRKLTTLPTPLTEVAPRASGEVDRLVMSMLARNPEARPSTREIGIRLAECLELHRRPDPTGSLASPLRSLAPQKAFRGAKRALPVLLAMVGVPLVVLAAVSILSRAPRPQVCPVPRAGEPILVESVATAPVSTADPVQFLPSSTRLLFEPRHQADNHHLKDPVAARNDEVAAAGAAPSSSPPSLVLAESIPPAEQEAAAVVTSSEALRLVSDAAEALGRRDYGLALSKGQDALATDAASFDAHMILARTNFLLDRFGDARRHFAVAVTIRPLDQSAFKGLAAAEMRELE